MSLYSMHSVILSQWRDRRMGMIVRDLGALTIVWTTELWICWRRYNWDSKACSRQSYSTQFGVNDRSSNGTSSCRIEVRPDTAKLTNLIVTGLGEWWFRQRR